MNLADKTCVPCRGDSPALREAEVEELRRQIPGWEVVENHHLYREFLFGNFREALAFVNQTGAVAEAQGHHPNIDFTWGRVGVKVFTHVIDGLTENDFILAAKISQI